MVWAAVIFAVFRQDAVDKVMGAGALLLAYLKARGYTADRLKAKMEEIFKGLVVNQTTPAPEPAPVPEPVPAGPTPAPEPAPQPGPDPLLIDQTGAQLSVQFRGVKLVVKRKSGGSMQVEVV
jgi:hypothetical protein